MFNHFTLGGLTIANLQAQVLGFLGNSFVIAALLAVLALVFVPKIAHLVTRIAMGGGDERSAAELQGIEFQNKHYMKAHRRRARNSIRKKQGLGPYPY